MELFLRPLDFLGMKSGSFEKIQKGGGNTFRFLRNHCIKNMK